MNFYLERTPLPKEQTHNIDSSSKLGDLISTDPTDLKATIVRVVENGIVCDLQTAKEIQAWLAVRIAELENRLNNAATGN